MALIGTDKLRIVVGLGQTGLSCARYFAQRGLAFEMVDSRSNPPGLALFRKEFGDVALHLGDFDSAVLGRADELIVSPGIALEEPAIAAAIKSGVTVIGDIDLFIREAHAPIVAITGSNGKSTVTTLVGEMAKAAHRNVGVGGNLGIPALDLLDAQCDLYVLELSSFQLERAQPINAEVAAVLNVSPDHMDRYASLQAYHRAKHRVFRGCKQIVVNRADALTRPLVPASVAEWTFGLDAPDFKGFGIREHGGERFLAFARELLMPVHELRIVGQHNIANALAALALGHAVGLPMPAMLQALRAFTGLAHRCQLVAEKNTVRFYDDSKGTNVGATIAAIEGLASDTDANGERKIVLIAGGVGKGAEFSGLASVLEKHGRGAVLIGEAANDIATALPKNFARVYATTMRDAVALAAQFARPGDSVLLSPACASFDMFDNYAHRGEMFSAAVKSYLETH